MRPPDRSWIAPLLAALLIAGLLASCGGDDSADTADVTQPDTVEVTESGGADDEPLIALVDLCTEISEEGVPVMDAFRNELQEASRARFLGGDEASAAFADAAAATQALMELQEDYVTGLENLEASADQQEDLEVLLDQARQALEILDKLQPALAAQDDTLVDDVMAQFGTLDEEAGTQAAENLGASGACL